MSHGGFAKPTRTGLGPGILHSSSGFQLEEEEPEHSLEEGEEYDEELEEDPDDQLDHREKLLGSDIIPYHKKPGFCMFSSASLPTNLPTHSPIHTTSTHTCD